MFPLRPLANSAPTTQGLTGGTQAPIAASHFQRHFVSADGNCLFRAIHMGLNGPEAQASLDSIRELKEQLMAYIDQRRFELEINAAFGYNGVEELIQHVPQLGLWNQNAVDFVAPLLAKVLGRDIVILEPIAGQNAYQLKQALPANNPELPQGREPTGQAAIYLGHIANGTHYEYLDPINPQALAQLIQQPGSAHTARYNTDHQRPPKKPRLEIKSETNKASPPVIAFVKAARFNASCYIDLTHASRAPIDLSPEGAAIRESIAINLIPNANINALCLLPIVQSPEDPTKPHPQLPQPASINLNMPLLRNTGHTAVALQARAHMDQLLKHPKQLQQHERTHFKLAKIQTKHLAHLPTRAPTQGAKPPRHPTFGMRGVIAAKALAAGTPLPYSGQYLDNSEYQKTVEVLSQELQSKTKLAPELADQQAKRLIASYSWEGVTYKGRRYDISSFGAGNTAAMINHDSQHANMGVAYMPTHDAQGQPAPKMVVYFALRDIAKDEQLLVDYGECYQFDERVAGSLQVESNAADTVITGSMHPALRAVKAELTQEPPQLAPTGAITASPSSNQQATPSLEVAVSATRQRALNAFLKSIENQLNTDVRHEDARQHAPFFFNNTSIPLKIKQSSLGNLLLRILQKNEAGTLKKLTADWELLSQLQPAIPPKKLLEIANQSGGGCTVDYLKTHWQTLNELHPSISTDKLLALASNNGASVTLRYLQENWLALNQLTPKIPIDYLLNIANHNSGSVALDYIKTHWTTLTQLQPPIDHKQLLDCGSHDGGHQNLRYIKENWTALNQLQPPIPPGELIKIANHAGSSQTFSVLVENWDKLNTLKPPVPTSRLIKIANKHGSSITLKYIRDHWPTLNQLQPKIAVEQLLTIANNNSAKNTLDYLKQHWSALNQLQPPLTPKALLNIANHDCGCRTLEYISQYWPTLTQLKPPLSPEKIAAIANHNGSRKTLDIIRNYWAELSQFSNQNGVKISIEELENICTSKRPNKSLETLLFNPHIGTLPMYKLISILTSESRLTQFIKDHPNPRSI